MLILLPSAATSAWISNSIATFHSIRSPIQLPGGLQWILGSPREVLLLLCIQVPHSVFTLLPTCFPLCFQLASSMLPTCFHLGTLLSLCYHTTSKWGIRPLLQSLSQKVHTHLLRSESYDTVVFSAANAERLPPRQNIDKESTLAIELQEGNNRLTFTRCRRPNWRPFENIFKKTRRRDLSDRRRVLTAHSCYFLLAYWPLC